MFALRLLVVGIGSIAWVGDARAGNVHVVGPGQQFTTVQAAIDAAADFDVIVVKTGTYVGFTIDDRQLAIVGAPGTPPQIVGEITVENLAPQRTVLLARLKGQGVLANTYALRSRQNLGAVVVERCTLKGPTGTPSNPTVAGTAAWVGFDARTRFVSSTFTGGWAGEFGTLFGGTYEGGEGLLTRSSNVTLAGCSLVGGRGSSVWEDDGWDGGNGGHGLEIPDGTVEVLDCSVQGGAGGNGDYESDMLFCEPGGNAGWGGDGVRLGVFGGVGTTALFHGGGSFSGGPAGFPGGSECGGSGAPGQPGLPIRVYSGTATQLQGPTRYLSGIPVASEGSSLSLTAIGAPGDVVHADVREVAPWIGGGGYHVAHEPTPCKLLLGTVPASGELDVSLPVRDLGPGVEARWWSITPRFADSFGVETTGTPLLVVLLDAAI